MVRNTKAFGSWGRQGTNNLFPLRAYSRDLLRGNRRRNTFCIWFWCLAWGSNPSCTFNNPTHYLLNHGDIVQNSSSSRLAINSCQRNCARATRTNMTSSRPSLNRLCHNWTCVLLIVDSPNVTVNILNVFAHLILFFTQNLTYFSHLT